MKKLLFVLAVAMVCSTTATAIEIAISTQAGWWGQAAADTEMAKIVANVKSVPVRVFTATDQAALATWVKAHTGDGASDLLILCGQFPSTIYAPGNTQPNGSLAELFLDDGNTIINTGDYIFYVVDGAGTNAAGGLQNMTDVPAAAMWGDDSLATTFVPTVDGKLYTPSLPTTPSNRPWFPAQFNGTDWYFELILAKNSDGTQVHPGILRNRVTGGRLGVFFQVADQFTDIRGQVISEWINNWYLKQVTPPMISANPSPADKATDIPRDVALGWKASAYAGAHDVYLGTTFADVNSASRTAAKGVLASQGQADVTFDPPGSLAYGQTYYWRVDEVNKTADSTIFKGSVWSFTVEPYGYPLTKVTATASTSQNSMGPEKTVDGSGMTGDQHGTAVTTMWMSAGVPPNWIQYQFDAVYKLDKLLVWNSNQAIEAYIGFGAKDVTVEYSVDGTTWAALKDVPQFAQGNGLPTYTANTTVNFGGAMAKFVKLTINKSWGGLPTTGLSEVRFSYVPAQARSPQPADAAKGVAVGTSLNWRPGREAGSHKVFLGTDQAAVTAGTAPAQTVTDHSFTPSALSFGKTYYWRVDEVNTVTYPGNVWSFTTQEFALVDNFESYNDTDNCIFDTWLDGMADTAKGGSQVGYLTAPFAETKIFHGGNQSMPLAYDNSKAPFLSETTRTFDTPQDCTGNGASYLSVWFRGRAVDFVDNGNNAFTMSSSGTDIWNNGDQFRFAYKTLTGDGTMVARVDSIVNTNVWAKAGVMIRQSVDAGSTHAFMPITPGGSGAGNGASFQGRVAANGASNNQDKTAPAIGAPYWVKIERKGNSFTGSISADGKAWAQLGTAQTITMTGPVLIGLAVCSHDAALTTVAEFSNVSTTGTVTGAWQAVAIGATMPTNGAAPVYVVVEDKAGKSKTVVNANPSATTAAAWTEWRIPLSSLTGVNMAALKKLTIGVGDKASPKANGAGMLYIDDVGYGTPLTAAAGAKLDLKITAGTNDAEEHLTAGMDVTSTDLEMPYEDDGTPSATDPQLTCLRYNVPVAKGVKIAKAYVEFTCDETKGGARPVNLIVEGQLAVNAAAFTANAKDLSSRSPWTKAQVKWTVENWTAAGQKSQTPDLSAILQEIVDQAGWGSNNALVLAFRDDPASPSTGIRCADASEDEVAGAGVAPVLHIELQ